MIAAIAKKIRLALLRWAIRTVEATGLSVVEIKKGPGVVYLRGSNGQYVRFDREKT